MTSSKRAGPEKGGRIVDGNGKFRTSSRSRPVAAEDADVLRKSISDRSMYEDDYSCGSFRRAWETALWFSGRLGPLKVRSCDARRWFLQAERLLRDFFKTSSQRGWLFARRSFLAPIRIDHGSLAQGFGGPLRTHSTLTPLAWVDWRGPLRNLPQCTLYLQLRVHETVNYVPTILKSCRWICF